MRFDAWQPEVVFDVISGRNVKTIVVYVVVNFEVTNSSSFRDIKKKHFVTAASVDFDDSIKRKRIHFSLKKWFRRTTTTGAGR